MVLLFLQEVLYLKSFLAEPEGDAAAAAATCRDSEAEAAVLAADALLQAKHLLERFTAEQAAPILAAVALPAKADESTCLGSPRAGTTPRHALSCFTSVTIP